MVPRHEALLCAIIVVPLVDNATTIVMLIETLHLAKFEHVLEISDKRFLSNFVWINFGLGTPIETRRFQTFTCV